MNKPITDMTEEELHAEIAKLRAVQIPTLTARKPKRVEPKQPKPGAKRTWRDQLFE